MNRSRATVLDALYKEGFLARANCFYYGILIKRYGLLYLFMELVIVLGAVSSITTGFATRSWVSGLLLALTTGTILFQHILDFGKKKIKCSALQRRWKVVQSASDKLFAEVEDLEEGCIRGDSFIAFRYDSLKDDVIAIEREEPPREDELMGLAQTVTERALGVPITALPMLSFAARFRLKFFYGVQIDRIFSKGSAQAVLAPESEETPPRIIVKE